MRQLSPEALAALFTPDADKSLAVLLTITGDGLSEPLRIANNFTQLLSETAEDKLYGMVSRGQSFTFIPFDIQLPTDEDAAPRSAIVLHDLTNIVLPKLRMLPGSPSVLIELVLTSSPDTVEAAFPGLEMGAIPYNKSQVTINLTVEDLGLEPFPALTFMPSIFPGLF